MFYVGQKVVCVDASVGPMGPVDLIKGRIYEVNGIAPKDVNGTPGITVSECKSPSQMMGGVLGFRVSRFRPLIERKTDISVFTEMLNTQPVGDRTERSRKKVGA